MVLVAPGRLAVRKALPQVIGPAEIAASRGEPWKESIAEASASYFTESWQGEPRRQPRIDFSGLRPLYT